MCSVPHELSEVRALKNTGLNNTALKNTAMKNSAVVMVALLCCVLSAQASAVDRKSLKYLASLYTDTKSAPLKRPEGLTCNADSLFVADTGNNRIVRYQIDNQALTPKQEYTLPNVTSLILLQVNSKGVVYALDGKTRNINMVNENGEFKGILELKNRPDSAAIVPRSFDIDSQDNLYLLDLKSSRVLVADASGSYLRQVPFPKDYGFFSDIAVNDQGNLYLLDSVKGVLYLAEGTALEAGNAEFKPFAENLKTYMNFPTNLDIDKLGLIYVLDQYGSGLAMLGQDGSFLGRKVDAGAGKTQLAYPTQVCINENRDIFIADRNNNRVQVYTVTGN